MMEEITQSNKTAKYKKFLPFIVAGIGVGLFALFTRKNNTTVTTPENTQAVNSSQDVTGLYNDIATSNTQRFTELENKINDLNTNYGSAMSNLYTDVNGNITELENQWNSDKSGITQTLTELQNNAELLSTKVSNGGSDTSRNLVGETLTKIQEDTAALRTMVSPVIPDTHPVQSIPSSVNGYIPTPDTLITVGEKVYDIGNNGAGYTKDSGAQLNAKLKDDAFKNAEIDRANKVIADRNALGLDTSKQTAYLKKIGG